MKNFDNEMNTDTRDLMNNRQHWMSIMARADYQEFAEYWQSTNISPEFTSLRPAEIGMIMLKGKVNGDGNAFNMGEATITRCSVQFSSGVIGSSYILGRNKQHAELAAVVDAQLQQGEFNEQIVENVLLPLSILHEQKQTQYQSKAIKTKVDFFTLLRGED